jgi:hypothetical protein
MHGRVGKENFGRIRSFRIQLTLGIYAEKNTDSGDIQVPSTWKLILRNIERVGITELQTVVRHSGANMEACKLDLLSWLCYLRTYLMPSKAYRPRRRSIRKTVACHS